MACVTPKNENRRWLWAFNFSVADYTYMRQRTGSWLVKILACRLSNCTPVPKPNLTSVSPKILHGMIFSWNHIDIQACRMAAFARAIILVPCHDCSQISHTHLKIVGCPIFKWVAVKIEHRDSGSSNCHQVIKEASFEIIICGIPALSVEPEMSHLRPSGNGFHLLTYEAWTKWIPFCRRHFHMHFLEWKHYEFWFTFHWNLLLGIQLTIGQHWSR